MKYKPDFTINDVRLLKTGRHFRITARAKLAVGRNEEENSRLSSLAREKDFQFYPIGTKGPVGIGRGVFNKKSLYTASSIIARYSDGSLKQQYKIAYKNIYSREINTILTLPKEETTLESLRI